MRVSRTDRSDFQAIADSFGINARDVANIMQSFFDVIVSEARSLPFDSPKKVFSKEAFGNYGSVFQIPSIGRLGPSYTRYRRWRANEAESSDIVNRKYYDERLRKEDIETIASEIIGGNIPDIEGMKKARKGKYNKVWRIGADRRHLAWQAIKKK